MAKKFDKVLKYKGFNDKDVFVHYTDTINIALLGEAASFIARLVINDRGEYKPWMLPYAEAMAMAIYYTELGDTKEGDSEEKNAKKIEKLAEIVNGTDIATNLRSAISNDQWIQLIKYAYDLIEYQKSLRPLDRLIARFQDTIYDVIDLVKLLKEKGVLDQWIESGVLDNLMAKLLPNDTAVDTSVLDELTAKRVEKDAEVNE